MLFLRGLIIGFSIAAPVGPIGVLVIRRSLRHGWLAGFISGLGAATADMLYGCVAAFGLKAISDLMLSAGIWLRGIGGIFLLYLGIRTFLARPAQATSPGGRATALGGYASTFILTLTNPLTILSFAAIFASIIPAGVIMTTRSSLEMVAGVFLGSTAWWLILSLISGTLQRHISQRFNQWIQWVSGIVIVIFGLSALLSIAGEVAGKI